jgi:uncharacterized membrane protein
MWTRRTLADNVRYMGTIRHVIEVNAPVDRAFRVWNDLENLPTFFDLVDTVNVDDDSAEIHYRGMLGRPRVIHLIITESVPNHVLSWKVVDSSVPLSGSITFEEAGKQTFITFVFSFNPPLVRVGDAITAILRYPHKNLEKGLSNIAEFLEKQE